MLAAVPGAEPASRRSSKLRQGRRGIQLQRATPQCRSPRSAFSSGDFYARRGLPSDAEAEYRAALRLEPQFVPAAVNLADLYRQLDSDRDGVDVLRSALTASPKDGGLHYALGFALIRIKQNDDALNELRRAAELAPIKRAMPMYTPSGLNSAGHSIDAIAVLKQSWRVIRQIGRRFLL